MSPSTRAVLEVELVARGFVREGHGLESPHGTLGIADTLLARATVSELYEAMLLRREKMPEGPEAMPARDDTAKALEALKALIDQAL